jgi:hypothetical protein
MSGSVQRKTDRSVSSKTGSTSSKGVVDSKGSGKLKLEAVYANRSTASTDIYLPSVRSFVDLSPRSKDSRSYANSRVSSPVSTSSFYSWNCFENLVFFTLQVQSSRNPDKSIDISPDGKVKINLPVNFERPSYSRSEVVPSPSVHALVYDQNPKRVLPIHRPSGELSVSLVSTDGSNPLTRGKKKKYGNNRGSLWGDDENTLEAVEAAKREAERLQKEMEDAKESEELRQKEEREAILQMKVLNTLFDKKFSTETAQWKSKAAVPTVDRPPSAKQNNQEVVHHQEQQQQEEKEHEKIESDNLTTGDRHNHEEGKEENQDSRPVSSPHKRNLKELVQNLIIPKFRSKDWRKEKISEGHSLTAEEKAHAMQEINSTISNLADSGIKNKLKDLASFVNRHTSRKIMNFWNSVEGRFKNSSIHKTVMTPDPHGLMHPVKHQALYLSSIISLLCSSRVKVGHQEVTSIFKHYQIADEDILLARQIAALNAVIQVCIETKSSMTETYKCEVSELMKNESKSLSINELMDVVFSSDPFVRNEEITFCKGNRQNEANKILEEKRRKDDIKDQLEKRKRKLIDDFEKILETMQVYKGIMTQNRLNAFYCLIKYCQKIIDEHHEDHSSRVPVDIITFVGLDAFPPVIRQLILARMHKTNRRPAKLLDPVQVNKAVLAAQAQKEKHKGGPREDRSQSIVSLDGGDSLSVGGSDSIVGSLTAAPSTRQFYLKGTRDHAEEGQHHLLIAGEDEEEEETYENKLMQFLLSDQSTEVGIVVFIQLKGPPVAMKCLREMVALAKTFPGFSYRDAVEIMQFIAATKIAAAMRGYLKKFRYFAARKKWTTIFNAIKKKYYEVWSDYTRTNITLRRYCLRKVVAWRYYNRRAHERRELFRICFWPFHVWRKETSATATAKEKTKFLVGRVMPTLLKMKIFRAWKGYSLFESHCKKVSTENFNKILQKRLARSFADLSFFAYQNRFLKRAWYRKGLALQRQNLKSRLRTVFYMWKMVVRFKKYIRARVHTEFQSYRSRLFGRKKPWKKLSFADKRMRSSAKRKASIEHLRKDALKKLKTRKSVVIGAGARRIADDVSVSSQNSDGSHSMNSLAEKIEDSMKENGKEVLIALNTLAQEKPVPIAQVKYETKLKRRNNQQFHWKGKTDYLYDVDSDGDDEIDVPPLLITIYNEMLLNLKPSNRRASVSAGRASMSRPAIANNNNIPGSSSPGTNNNNAALGLTSIGEEANAGGIASADQRKAAATPPTSLFVMPASVDSGIIANELLQSLPPFPKNIPQECVPSKIKEGHFFHPEYLENKNSSITRGYQTRDIWNLFESAFRFHHFAYTAFNNLRHNARVKKKVKMYKQQKKYFMISFYFQEWKIFLRNNLNLIEENKDLDGETGEDIRSKKTSVHLYHTLRSHLTQKTLKLRKLNDEIRKYYKKFYHDAGMEGSDDEYDEEKRARRRVRKLNQLDMDDKSSEEDENNPNLDNADKFKSYRLRKAKKDTERQRPLTPIKIREKPNPFESLDFDAILSPSKGHSKGGGGAVAKLRGDDSSQNSVSSVQHYGVTSSGVATATTTLTTGNTSIVIGGEVIPPGRFNNLFEWDNYNREVEMKCTEEMVKYSHKVKSMVKTVIEKSTVEHLGIVAVREQYEELVEEILAFEGANALKAVARQHEYSIMFKIHAANYLLMKLAKVYYEVQYNIIKEETKKYFRLMRLPMLHKRSLHLFKRKRLQNYIRLCKRLQYISEHAPFYYRIRLKYITLMKWSRYLEKTKLNPTPNFVNMIKRRLALHPDFHLALIKKGFGMELDQNPNKLYENQELQLSLSDFSMIFKRWKMYAQEEILFRLMEERAAKLFALKLMLKALICLRNSSINATNYVQYLEKNYNEENSCCFMITRLKADLEQLSKRFIPLRKKQLPTKIKKSNLKISRYMKEQGKNSLTYKKFLTDFQNSVMQRINTEQRLLFEAFETRGKQEFVDAQYPFSRDDPIIPPLMSKIEGKVFRDPHLPSNAAGFSDKRTSSAHSFERNTLLKESNIPGGFRLHKIKFAMIIHNANKGGGGGDNNNTGGGGGAGSSSILTGWQLVWSAEGMREIESTPRGTWNAAGISIQEIAIPKDDFMIGLEYLYDGPTIVSLRLKLLQNGWTKWIGGKASLSTLSIYLDVNMSPSEDFESDRRLHEDELKTPALPWRYIIGFSGILYNQRPTCLGLMIRKIKYQHIFSYTWVYDVILQKRFQNKNSENPALAIQKGIQAPLSVGDAVGSIPSEIHQRHGGGPGNEFLDESLTLSHFDSTGGGDFLHPGGGESQASFNRSVSDDGQDTASIHLEPAEDLLKKTNMGGGGGGGKRGGGGDNHSTDNSVHSHHHDTDNHSVHSAESASTHHSHGTGGGDDDDFDGLGGGGRGGGSASGRGGGDGSATRGERMKKAAMKRFQQWNKNHQFEEPLTVSETQFFDLLRMRLTELTVAKQRCEEFSRKMWTSKEFRMNPLLCKLLSLKIISSLTKWLFNALSKKLGRVCATEKRGLKLIKQATKYITSTKSIQKRKNKIFQELKSMEATPQPWANKALLGPMERQQKKEFQGKIQELRTTIINFDKEMQETLKRSTEVERKGRLLLPRIALSLPVYNNFRMKLSAARHKQSLLENMTLDEIKNGLFGSNMKETLLNKDQMEAIHASLRDRKLELKDTTSLQRLVDAILVEENEKFEDEIYLKQQSQFYGGGGGGGGGGNTGTGKKTMRNTAVASSSSAVLRAHSPPLASQSTRRKHSRNNNPNNPNAVDFTDVTTPTPTRQSTATGNNNNNNKLSFTTPISLSSSNAPLLLLPSTRQQQPGQPGGGGGGQRPLKSSSSTQQLGSSEPTKLPAIGKRFQSPQLAHSQSEKKTGLHKGKAGHHHDSGFTGNRRMSSSSMINMTNENSPRDEGESRGGGDDDQSLTNLSNPPIENIKSNNNNNNNNKNNNNKNINIKLSSASHHNNKKNPPPPPLAMRDDLDESSSVISNITGSPIAAAQKKYQEAKKRKG